MDSELKVNYYALCIAVLTPATPELAFRLMQSDEDPKIIWAVRKDITPQDVEDMKKLKKEMTYPQLAEVYAMSPHQIYERIKRRRKSKAS